MAKRTNNALAIVDQSATTIHREIQPEQAAGFAMLKTRTQQQVLRRHTTNMAAILTKTEETKLAIDAEWYLTRHSFEKQVEAALEANALIRGLTFEADYDDVVAIADQTKGIHNRAQQHVLASALNDIGGIIDRELIVEDDRSVWTRAKTMIGEALTGQLPEG